MKILKKIVQNLVSMFNFKIVKINKKKFKEFDSIYKILINKESLIIDVGANKGQSIERFLKLKDPKIYSFEPSEKSFKILKKKFESNKYCILNNFALGENKKEELFFEYENDELNSFNSIKNSNNMKVTKKKILVDTLDNYSKRNNFQYINLLKIDTQGYEENVLKGSINFIKQNKIDIIELELILGNYYEKFTSFYNIEKILKNGDYRLIALDRRPNIFENNKLYFNAIYISGKLYNKHFI